MAHSDVYSYSPIIKDHPSPSQLHLTITTSQRPSSTNPITLEIRASTYNLGGRHKHSVCNRLFHFFLFSSFILSFLSILLRFVHVIVYLLSVTFYCWLVFFCIRIPQMHINMQTKTGFSRMKNLFCLSDQWKDVVPSPISSFLRQMV